MQDDIFSGLMSVIDENFSSMDSAIVMPLLKNNEQYVKLNAQQGEITKRFPRLIELLEQAGTPPLSEEECAALSEYLVIAAEMENIERQAIYFAGHKDCFAYLKSIGII